MQEEDLSCSRKMGTGSLRLKNLPLYALFLHKLKSFSSKEVSIFWSQIGLICLMHLLQELGLSPSVPVHVVLQDWIRHSDGKLNFLGFVRLIRGVSARTIQKVWYHVFAIHFLRSKVIYWRRLHKFLTGNVGEKFPANVLTSALEGYLHCRSPAVVAGGSDEKHVCVAPFLYCRVT